MWGLGGEVKMKLNEMAFANAFTAVGIGVYVLCRLVSLVAPDLLFSVGKSWFHTFSLDSVRTVVPMDLGTFLLGGVTLGALTWVTFYAGAMLYNNLAKK